MVEALLLARLFQSVTAVRVFSPPLGVQSVMNERVPGRRLGLFCFSTNRRPDCMSQFGSVQSVLSCWVVGLAGLPAARNLSAPGGILVLGAMGIRKAEVYGFGLTRCYGAR